ncbi:MAG: hypothetical protein NXI32_02285 [bacterium]|nr:hypothetical protein [bacterium]
MRRRLAAHHPLSLTCGIALAAMLTLNALQATAQDNDSAAGEGPWISSIVWQDDSTLLGCNSRGLLLQPAELVKVQVEALQELQTIGQAETSLWTVLPIDQRIVATDYKGGIHIFGDGDPRKFELQARWIRATATTPAEGEILAGTEDGKLLLLSIDDLSELKRVDVHDAAIFDIAWSPDGNTVATAAGNGKIKLMSWPELEIQGEMSRGPEGIWSLAFTPDGKHLVSGGADRRIQLWDVENRQSICTITRTGDWITDLKMLPASSLVVAGCMDGNLVIADYSTLSKVDVVEAAQSAIWSLALNSDATQLALGTRKHGIQLVATQGWQEKAQQIAQDLASIRPPSPAR